MTTAVMVLSLPPSPQEEPLGTALSSPALRAGRTPYNCSRLQRFEATRVCTLGDNRVLPTSSAQGSEVSTDPAVTPSVDIQEPSCLPWPLGF